MWGSDVNAKRHRWGAAAVSLAVVLLAGPSSGGAAATPVNPWEQMPKRPTPTDHSTFFQQPFPDGPSVTRACLECHPDAAAEVMATAHWNFAGDEVEVPGHDQPMRIGKRNLINNFCIGISSNWPACTQCHIGYGWEDETFDFTDPTRVDCLVCHDNSATYLKKVEGAGLPDESVDLLVAARSVGLPKRHNCGGCHFQGGGENAVKHGDLDNTLLFPSGRIDVHMGRHDMVCIDCHAGERHLMPGRAISVSVDRENRLHCTACHDAQPHADLRLNAHMARVACQACHIPYMAVDTGTKLTWDWSQAGQDLDITNSHQYLKIKGRFTWAKKVEPEYYWYNEQATRYILGDRIDPSRPTVLTGPLGDRNDPTAKLWPFKVHRGKQPYDVVKQYFLIPHVHGDEGFWTKFDWPSALKVGAQLSGLPYSGQYDFAPTEMYLKLTHMITTADQALQCRDCHGERGRLDWSALGYDSDPLGRKTVPHEPVYLFDANGDPVTASGLPLSTATTCGSCHELDVPAFVQTHGYHTDIHEQALPAERRTLLQDGPRLAVDDGQQMNCFLCHLAQPNHAERARAIAAGSPEWSVTATLVGTELVERTAAGYAWNTAVVSEDGEAQLALGAVREQHCGACHGLVHDGATPLMVDLGEAANWTTATTGQVFSPQRIRLSGMNLQGKDDLDLAWDVHAERVVACGDCHYAKNRPARLAGAATAAEVQPYAGGRRRCASCHDLDGTHNWLEKRDRHLRAVACEACHIPELTMAAQRQVDGTVMRPDGTAAIAYRGLLSGSMAQPAQAYIAGYRPLLRVGRSPDGTAQVLPYNLVASWHWVDSASDTPVPAPILRSAWLDGDHYAAEVLAGLDQDADGVLAPAELRLDTPAKVALIRDRLRAAGVAQPEIRGELRAYQIHHGVRHGARVGRDCTTCHAADRQQAPQPLLLGDYLPGGVVPTLVKGADRILLDGAVQQTAAGTLVLQPNRDAAGSYQSLQKQGN